MGSGNHGPSDFPFTEGEHIAVRVLDIDGERWWVGELISRGSGGFVLRHPNGVRMWVPWDSAPVRDLLAGEWDELTAVHGGST